MKKTTIGIFGHYGNQNLGDEAIIEATIQNLRRLIPDVELRGLSINPADTQERYGIEVFPIRYRADFFNQPTGTTSAQPGVSQNQNSTLQESKSDSTLNTPPAPVKRSLPVRIVRGVASRLYHRSRKLIEELIFLSACKKQLKDIDLLIVCGSNQFLDNFGGPWGFPYTLLKWTLLAKSCGTKVAFVSIGAGPIYKKLSYFMLGKALRRADYLSYRDVGSKQLIEDHIDGVEGIVCPDIAHSLLNPFEQTQSEAANNDAEQNDGKKCDGKKCDAKKSNGKLIALNPMPVFDPRYWYKADQEKLNHYINAMANFVIRMLGQGYHVVLFNTQTKDINSMEDIQKRIEEINPELPEIGNLALIRHHKLEELSATLASADIVVATRFHATVLPLRMGKPTFGVSYYRKADELLDDIGLTGCYVSIDNFTEQELEEKFADFLAELDSHRENVRQNFSKYCKALDEQWNQLVSLVAK